MLITSVRAAVWQAHIFLNKPHIVKGSLNAFFFLLHSPPWAHVCNSDLLCFDTNIFLFFFGICISTPPSFHCVPIENLIADPLLQLVYTLL